jgi:hypothetical protein
VWWKPAELPVDGPGWRCERCAPPGDVRRHACVMPGVDGLERTPLPYPPGWQGWPDEPVRKPDEPGLPDPATAPLGRCRSCRFTAPLGGSGSCGACEHVRLLAAAEPGRDTHPPCSPR